MRFRRMLAAAAFVFAACGGSSSSTGPGDTPSLTQSVTLEQGQGQHTEATHFYPDSIVARATDEEGNPIPGQIINFQLVTEGAGSFAARTLQTRADGRVFNRWRAGEKAWTWLWDESRDTMHVAELIASRDGRPDLVETVRAVTEPGPAVSTSIGGSGPDTKGPSPHVLPLVFNDVAPWVEDAHGNPVPFDLQIRGDFAHVESVPPKGNLREIVADTDGCGRFDLVVGDTLVAWGALRSGSTLEGSTLDPPLELFFIADSTDIQRRIEAAWGNHCR